MKYVMIQWAAFRLPIIFPDQVDHCQVADNTTVVSAGFVTPTGQPYGKSVSLKKGPAIGDADILEAFMTGREAMLHLVQ